MTVRTEVEKEMVHKNPIILLYENFSLVNTFCQTFLLKEVTFTNYLKNK